MTVGVLCFLCASPWVFPGESAFLLARACGANPFPLLAHPLWEGWIRLCAAVVPPSHFVSVVNAANLLFAALSVGLLFSLGWKLAGSPGVGRARDVMRQGMNETPVPNIVRGMAGGWGVVSLATALPFQIAATRALPHGFDAVLLLLALHALADFYRQASRVRIFSAAGLLGLALAEHGGFLPIVLVVALVIPWALLRNRLIEVPLLSHSRTTRWRLGALVISGICMVLGFAAPLLIKAWLLTRGPAAAWMGMEHGGDVVWRLLAGVKETWESAWPARGWALTAAITAGPVMLVLAAALGSDGRTAPRTGLILLLPFVLAVALSWNLRIAPWVLFGLSPLSVAPSLVVAIWAAGLGAIWSRVLGLEFLRIEQKYPPRTRIIPAWVRGALGWGLPAAAWAAMTTAAVLESRGAAQARGTDLLRDALSGVISEIPDRSWLISSGWADDALRIAAYEQGRHIRVVSWPQILMAPVGRYLGDQWRAYSRLSGLTKHAPDVAMMEWMRSDAGRECTFVFDAPELWIRAGMVPVPRGLVSAGLAASTKPEALLPLVPSARFDRVGTARRLALLPPSLAPAARHMTALMSRQCNDFGVLLASAGHRDQARMHFEEAVSVDSGNRIARYNLAVLDPDASARQGRVQSERSAIEKMPANERRNLAVYGLALRDAAATFSASAAIQEESAPPPVSLAQAELHRRFDRAFRAAAAGDVAPLRGSDGTNAVDRAVLLAATALLEQARNGKDAGLAALSQVRRAFPEDALVVLLSLTIHAMAGMTADAGRDMELADQRHLIVPPRLELVLASAEWSKGDFDAARARTDRIIRRAPAFVLAQDFRLLMDVEQKETELARIHAVDLLRLDPDWARANQVLGVQLLEEGCLVEAEALLRHASRQHLTVSLANDLARVLTATGQSAEAEQLAMRALDEPGAFPELSLTLSQALLAQGKKDAAIKALDDGLRRWPHHEGLQKKKGEIPP